MNTALTTAMRGERTRKANFPSGSNRGDRRKRPALICAKVVFRVGIDLAMLAYEKQRLRPTMPRPRDPRTLRCEFERTYELGRSALLRELERSVCGCDYGATSWTSRDEADRLAEHLRLGPEAHLLDIGAGSGWPGLYLAKVTGCEVTLADMPFAGLQLAKIRASEDDLSRRARVVAADGARLPFREETFAAISHSDVLCCMPEKLAMLQECRRISRPGARMVFSVIALAANLCEAERSAAVDGAPSFVESSEDYAVLLGYSGWRLLERTDVTAAFARAARCLLDGMEARHEALTALYGPDEFAELVRRRQATLAATGRGLVKRELFVATNDDRSRPRERTT